MQTAQAARAYYDAINRRDFEALAAAFDEKASLVDPAVGTFTGRAGAREEAQGWMVPFPDVRAEVKSILATGDHAVVEFIARGTHTGPLELRQGTIGPTGRSIELPICDVLTIRDGRILKMRTYYDSASLLGQLGLVQDLPVPGARAEELRVQ